MSVLGQSGAFHAEAMQTDAHGVQYTGDGADLGGGLASADAAQPDEPFAGEVDAGGGVLLDVGQIY